MIDRGLACRARRRHADCWRLHRTTVSLWDGCPEQSPLNPVKGANRYRPCKLYSCRIGQRCDSVRRELHRREVMHRADAGKQLHVTGADLADEPRKAPGAVVTYSTRDAHCPAGHERATQAAISRALAELKGFDFPGEYEPSCHYP